jgi:hypothetical protein
VSWLDRVRALTFVRLDKLPRRLGELVHQANDALGRPLAGAEELADRRAFAARAPVGTTAVRAPEASEQAPVIVYFMDKQKRDVSKLTDILDANGITYIATNIQEDPAAQYAVKRDSRGRLPVVFVAGDCVGAREELINLASSGELRKRVFG